MLLYYSVSVSECGRRLVRYLLVSPEFPGVLLVRISSVKREKGSRKAHDWSPSHPGSATGVLWALRKVQAIIGVGAMGPTAECRNLPHHQTELLHSALHQ